MYGPYGLKPSVKNGMQNHIKKVHTIKSGKTTPITHLTPSLLPFYPALPLVLPQNGGIV